MSAFRHINQNVGLGLYLQPVVTIYQVAIVHVASVDFFFFFVLILTCISSMKGKQSAHSKKQNKKAYSNQSLVFCFSLEKKRKMYKIKYCCKLLGLGILTADGGFDWYMPPGSCVRPQNGTKPVVLNMGPGTLRGPLK